jgi:hypothetical protein
MYHMTGIIKVEVIEGKMKGKCFEFRQQAKVVGGRSSKCQISLSMDSRLSRRHFILEINYPVVTIRDLGSTNGTYVNGARYGGFSYGEIDEQDRKDPYSNVALKDGDFIKVGRTVLMVKIEESAVCGECGVAIPDNDLEQPLVSDDTHLCGNCRRKYAQSTQPPNKLSQIRCQICSRFIPTEVVEPHQENHICQSCQLKSQHAVMHSMRYISPDQPEQPYSHINDFIIERHLGNCGFGSVYLASSEKDNLPVVINVIRVEIPIHEKRGGLIQQHLQNTQIFNTPKIVVFNDCEPDTFTFAFIMEVCSGVSIENFLIRTEAASALN